LAEAGAGVVLAPAILSEEPDQSVRRGGMSLDSHPPLAESLGVPLDRLYRLGDDQYRQMIDSGILDAETVERRDGILSVRHPASSDLLDQFYQMSVEQYDEATNLGILTKYDPIELIEGLLI